MSNQRPEGETLVVSYFATQMTCELHPEADLKFSAGRFD